MSLSTFTGGFGGFTDPFYDQLERSIDRAMNRMVGGPGFGRMATDVLPFFPTTTTTGATPTGTSADWWRTVAGTHPMDVVETDKCYEITADAPGFSPEDISVEVHDGNIMIRGQKREEREEQEEGGRVWRSERAFRSFHRTFRLPDDVKEEHIDANLDHGVLKVSVPKVEESERPKPKKISVKHGGGMEKVTAGGVEKVTGGGQSHMQQGQGKMKGREKGGAMKEGEKPAPMATE